MEMLQRCRNILTAVAAIVLLSGLPLSSQALQVGTVTERALDPSSSGQSTCLSRSINYITQTLPQQCLRTDWSRETEAPTLSSTSVGVDAERSLQATSAAHDSTASTESEIQDHAVTAAARITSYPGEVATTTTTDHQVTLPPSSSTTTTLSQPETTGITTVDSDDDSPLDKANFLSFEEWKRLNLAKAGQSADHVGASRAGIGEAEQRRKPGPINNAFDSLGEDTEIDIDFGGFASPRVPSQAVSSGKTGADGGMPSSPRQPEVEKHLGDVPKPHHRGKDAGKTCKERSNYASFDCAATVLKTNPECKGSNSVLVENKDSYMLNECSARNKFFIVELCDDILIDTVVLANFEFFSSMFRTFKVSVSDRYPVKLDKWRELGIFEARNSREVQAFLIENPLIWARYIRVEFLAHFGNEYYCPVSLFRVHGTTMMEEFNHDMKSSIGDDDPENEISEEEESQRVSGVVTADALKDTTQNTSEQVPPIVVDPTLKSTSPPAEISSKASHDTPGTDIESKWDVSDTDSTPFDSSLRSNMELLFASQKLCSSDCALEDQTSLPSPTVPSASSASRFTGGTKTIQAISSQPALNHMPTLTNGTSTEISNKSIEKSVGILQNISESSNHTKTSSSSPKTSHTSQNYTKSHPSTTHPSSPNPTTQESFFKSVHKRLQLLESNSTLSLQYIEDQSRILRDAFSAVEKRQLTKSTNFLETLNSTVLNELREFRNQYDQIWQSTILELSAQREISQHEILAISARISLLADEIVYQKRIAILQFALILLCLCLVIFSRNGSSANYFEFPSLAFNRSSSNLSGFGPHFETPPSTRPSSRYGIFGRGNAHERNTSSPPRSVRSSSRYAIFRRRNAHERSPSEESTLNGLAKGPDIEYSPPTPISRSTGTPSDGEEGEGANEVSSESSDLDQGARKIHSSPATLGRNAAGRREFDEGGLLTSEPDDALDR